MLSFIGSFLATWLILGFIVYMVSYINYVECLRHTGVLLAMFFVGWVPAIFVAQDVEELLKNKESQSNG